MNLKNQLLKKENKDPIKQFRVYDPNRKGSNEWSRYHIENILGYHPAGLSSYQDFESMLSPEAIIKYYNRNQTFPYCINMLNIKYLIFSDNISPNPSSMDRAFFVEELVFDHKNDKDVRVCSAGV